MLLSKSALEECIDWDDPGTDSGDDLITRGDPSSPYDAVIVGLAPTLLDYAHLNTAFRILVGENENRPPVFQPDSDIGVQAKARARPPLITLHKARYLQASDHALSLGPGPFVHALEDAAQTSATVVGKPTRAFFEAVLSDLDHDLEGGDETFNPCGSPHGHGPDQPPPSRPHRWEGIAVIGDDVHADLGEGASELGLWRVLGASGPLVFADTLHHASHSLSMGQ